LDILLARASATCAEPNPRVEALTSARGMGINENLRVGGYSPGIAYVRSKGQPPSTAKESYHFTLSFIGLLTSRGCED